MKEGEIEMHLTTTRTKVNESFADDLLDILNSPEEFHVPPMSAADYEAWLYGRSCGLDGIPCPPPAGYSASQKAAFLFGLGDGIDEAEREEVDAYLRLHAERGRIIDEAADALCRQFGTFGLDANESDF
jgi:hypothetical protein